MKTQENIDIIVVGAGISGLGAALQLKEQGLNVLVLEKDARVGGRMTTDRINGFTIDRGATIFGGRFVKMRALMKKLNMDHLAESFNFSFGLQEKTRMTKMRRARLDDLLLSNIIGFKAKLAVIKFGLDVALSSRKLGHGNSAQAGNLDNVSVEDYMEKIGGTQFLQRVLLPGLNGPMGGGLVNSSKLILFQTFWNILLMKTWAIKGGTDQVPEAMSKRLDIILNCKVNSINTENGCTVNTTINGKEKTFRSKGVIIAIPGNIAAGLCNTLPSHVKELLSDTRFGAMTSAHVMMEKPTTVSCAGYGISRDVDYGYEIELEHNRVQGLCPQGKGMSSIYFWDEPGNLISRQSDEEIKTRAAIIAQKHFPECNSILSIHIARWKEGIAHFPAGRLSKMSALRKEMAEWDLPVQLCGDYLDGIATESALATGQEAATNIYRHLSSRHSLN